MFAKAVSRCACHRTPKHWHCIFFDIHSTIRLMKRIALLPLVLAFVLAPIDLTRCAEAAHDFSKWEKEISAFEKTNRTNPPPKGGQVFIGSSTIRMWSTLAQDFPNHKVINRGFGGSEIVDS